MKKIMTLAIIALASVAMVACCGQPKKQGACGEPCCQPKVECQQFPAKAECPKVEEVKPACPAEKCAECPKKAECTKATECTKAAECPQKTECAKKAACPKAAPTAEAAPESLK
jgi:hypothetical protein